MSFFDNAFLWRDAVIASVGIAMALSLTGAFVILRRVVFLPAALSQVSGLGVVLSFWLATKIPSLTNTPILDPFASALTVTLIAALLLGSLEEPRRLSREAVTGISYIIASGLIVAIGAVIPQESHTINDVLFGNAVMVAFPQMLQGLIVSIGVIALQIRFHHPFLLVSLDAETARAHGVPVRTIDGMLFLSMGLIIAVATKTIGAMPVFAFSVLPPSAALLVFGRATLAFVAAPIMGAISAFVGYYISFSFDLPTGACTVVTAGGFFVLTLAPTRLVRRLRRNR